MNNANRKLSSSPQRQTLLVTQSPAALHVPKVTLKFTRVSSVYE